MGDIRSPTHPHSHVLSIKTMVVEVFFLGGASLCKKKPKTREAKKEGLRREEGKGRAKNEKGEK